MTPFPIAKALGTFFVGALCAASACPAADAPAPKAEGLMLSGAVNSVGHKWGKRPYDGQATNNQWLAWLVVGEGLHDNHHAASTSSRLSLAKGEFDPGWWCIRLLVRLRCATLRHTTLVSTGEATR